MLLKMEKDVNAFCKVCESRRSWKRFPLQENLPRKKKKKCNNALALAVSCGRLAAFTAPLFRIQGCTRCRSRGAENPTREVALHGPRFTRGHLADYVRQL